MSFRRMIVNQSVCIINKKNPLHGRTLHVPATIAFVIINVEVILIILSIPENAWDIKPAANSNVVQLVSCI